MTNGLPRPVIEGGKWALVPHYPWYNFGYPFMRLSNVPHHLVTQAALAGALLFALLWWQSKTPRPWYVLVFLLIGFVLGSLQPIQWAIMSAVLGVSSFIFLTRLHLAKEKQPLTTLARLFIPPAALIVSGLPVALYMKMLFATEPFTTIAAWENAQQTAIPLLHFLFIHGPLAYLAIVGLPGYFRFMDERKIVLSLAAGVPLLLFYSPLPQIFAILNLRFLSSIYVLWFVCISGELVQSLALRFRKKSVIASYLLAAIILIPTYISTARHIRDRNNFVPIADSMYYLPVPIMNAYTHIRNLLGPNDTVLTPQPFNSTFPAITGRRIFYSNIWGTIGYTQKEREANAFFADLMSLPEKTAFLQKNHITHIFTHTGSSVLNGINSEILYQSNAVILVKIRQ